MGTLVDDLFLLAQLDHQRPLRIEPVDLADLVRRSVAGIGASAPDRRVDVDAVDAMVIDGDEHRIRQVVDNLLVNAVAHTPNGVAIGVRLAGEGDCALITVHDDGPGIDPTDATKIFQPFFRSDPSRSRASGGSGLGLAIVAAIVAAHHGTVRVVPGPGATFEVRLPQRDPTITGQRWDHDRATAT
jgi:two-component system OmpR family sensor kinase